ncbi:MAG: MATE family efflux transporter [Chloroflexi bacterium]|nr:MATE family efflux transporter [Chloroflexota bacterium]
MTANPGPARRAWALVRSGLPSGAILLAVLTFAGYAMGLVRDRLFARTYGAGAELDAYNAAFVLPELLLDVLVAGGLVAAFVPVFTGLRGAAGTATAGATATAHAFGRTVLTLAVLVMAVVSVCLFVLAPQTAALIVPGFAGAQLDLYVGLFRVMCITPTLFAASLVLGEVLVAERRFLAVGLAPLMYNAGIVAGTVLLADRLGIYAAALGAVAGAVAHLAVRLVAVRRTSFRVGASLAVRVRGLGEFARLMLPRMLAYPIEPLTFLYFTFLASSLTAGSISSVSFARNFQSVPVSLVGASFAIAAFPVLAGAAAAGDRRGFRRTFTTNLVTITLLTTAAAVALVVLGEVAIRVLLGGGAFDEEDVARTAGLLAVFALAVPLESLTHLLARALYSTHNTILPTLASIAGFVLTIVAAETLAPVLELMAIPVAFTAGMAVKVALLAIAIGARMTRIGAGPAEETTGQGQADGEPGRARVGSGRRRQAGLVLAGLAVVALAFGTIHAADQALRGASLAVVPAETAWPREHEPELTPAAGQTPAPSPIAATPEPSPASPSPEPSPSGAPASPAAGSPGPTPAATPTATPARTPTPRSFAMDLYRKGDFVGELTDTWCLAAAVQTMMNVMDKGADRTRATQARLFRLTRSLAPSPDGAAEPEGWAMALTRLGYGRYEVRVASSIRAAVRLAARQIRATNRPVGLLVWKGAHSWVVSGFRASADPAATEDFDVTALNIEDVWYPRFSTIWGYSRPPDSLVPVGRLDEDYLPWKRRLGSYPDKNGRYVLVVPVE